MRTTGSVSTITYTTTVTATVSLVSLASGVKWVSHMTHTCMTHVHTGTCTNTKFLHTCSVYIVIQLHSAIGV